MSPTSRRRSCSSAGTNASSPTGASPTPRRAEPRKRAAAGAHSPLPGIDAGGGDIDASNSRRVAVAFSGGRDSTALLHATAKAAAASGVAVVALHVHHGLQPQADDWLAHCHDTCARWSADLGVAIGFGAERLRLAPARGESVEAWAREARYRALRRLALASGARLVLLAHHRRDQAETFLLQALRGGGAAGLSGMPSLVVREGITWARPWLSMPARSIDAYVRHHRLSHIDDASNADRRYARNRLRADVWPALEASFADAESTLAAAAARAQQARSCLDDLAALDLAPLLVEGALDVAGWLQLSPARARNALRLWLTRQAVRAPAALVERLTDELAGRGPARWPVDAGELRRYRGLLRFHPAAAGQPARRALREVTLPTSEPDDADSQPPAPRATLSIVRAGRYAVAGWHGHLNVRRVLAGGVALERLRHASALRRQGGETFQFAPSRPPRLLKKQYQALGVPPWERDGPIIWSGGEVVYVPRLGLDARILAAPGQPQVTLEWVDAAAPVAPARADDDAR